MVGRRSARLASVPLVPTVPAALRPRLATFVLLAAFLVPVGTSSLRGLTHVLTCRQQAEVPFTLIVPASGPAVIISSTTISRDAPEGICGGLLLDVGVGPTSRPGRVSLRLAIANRTDFDWKGTVALRLGGTSVPVDIGEIRHGQTAVTTVAVHAPQGQTDLQGSLLIGP
jgi:hypothetical protein